jgi:predicted phage replisome organizer
MADFEQVKQEKTRYWLKLDKDFLKSPHIKVIKSMPNGKDYVLFYLSLMLESVESIGHLKFTDLIPYNYEMLSALTDTNIDIVRNAVKVFESLGLIQILDDGTIFVTQVAEMTGKRSESADRVAKFRANKNAKALLVTKCNDNIDIQSIKYKEDNTSNKVSLSKNSDTKNSSTDNNININSAFESVWKLYPNKKGKGKVSDKAKKTLFDKGEEQIKRCIERYLKELKKDEWRHPQNGSTFFTSGYVDYLDENYTDKKEVKNSGYKSI